MSSLLMVGMMLLAGGTTPAAAQGKMPGALAPPEGNELLLKLQAEGVQIYVSKEVEPGKLAWVFASPLADLSAEGKRAGYHYAGPAWESSDGSKVVRDEAEKVVNVPAPDAKADIPWLLIRVKADGKAGGVLAKATYVVRAHTQGGVAPAMAPTKAGTEVGVRYKATYYFYGPAR
jgi:hypothetical protein